MDENKIIELWRSSNEKLEKSYAIAAKNTEDITRLKVQGLLSSMKPVKMFGLAVGILWVGIGIVILAPIWLHSFAEANKFFLFSASIQVVISAVAILVYLYQIITINKVDIAKPIISVQKELSDLKKSTLWITRILFLQLPLWTTYYWNQSMFENWNEFQWLVQISITLSFTILAIWLFFNLKYENRDKKWFKLIFQGKEWQPLMKSMELLDQIEEYQKVK